VRYDLIAGKLIQEEADLGLIIHEERFTYQDRGLEIVQDLGDFWEKKSGLPIPLGAIAVRRDMDRNLQIEIDKTLRKSLALSWGNPEKAQKYILENSQEKNLEVVQAHINLYVNSFTDDLGAEGKKAVLELQKQAVQAGILPSERNDLFLEE
ncbi:MAG TPA: menaquinone biosynthesis protein, partial [Leptospiraceae bacterium]|nr:menaquinone biosynthesis protein [Leptospiraceae bacterium]